MSWGASGLHLVDDDCSCRQVTGNVVISKASDIT